MWQIIADLPMVWAVVILIGALVRRRRSIARDMVLSVVVGVIAWLLLGADGRRATGRRVL